MKGNREEEKGLELRTNGGLTSYYRTNLVKRLQLLKTRSSSQVRLEWLSFASILVYNFKNCDQNQISLCNNNAYSTLEVMRIKDVITESEFS